MQKQTGNFTVNCHVVNQVNITVGTIRRVDIAPTLSIFPRAVALAPQFQSYRITRVSYRLLPRFNISSPPGSLPLLMRVPLTSADLPLSTVTAFSSYDKLDLKIGGMYSGSGQPYAFVAEGNSSITRSPKLNSSQLDRVHYLHSILIAAHSSAAVNYLLQQTITVEFYNFDG